MGRGNIAYGAKSGSNHTSRCNDQESFFGEGVFLGKKIALINNSISIHSIIVLINLSLRIKRGY